MTVRISAMLAVEDAQAASAWIQQALGATQLWSLGSVVGLEIAGAPFFLHEPTASGFDSPAALGRTTARVKVFTDDPDSFVARAVAAGADGNDEIIDHQFHGASTGREDSAIRTATSGLSATSHPCSRFPDSPAVIDIGLT
jgi:PhnB protein